MLSDVMKGPSDRAKEVQAGTSVRRRRYRSPRLWLAVFTALYVALLGSLSVANAVGPERWWWGSLNVYLPQWLWGAPGLVVLAASFRVARRWIGVYGLCLLWVFGPLMGFCWAPLSGDSASPGGVRLRVMTYNV